MSSIYEVEIFIRDLESNEVIERETHWMEVLPGQRLELWVDDKLKFEEEEFHPRGLSTKARKEKCTQ